MEASTKRLKGQFSLSNRSQAGASWDRPVFHLFYQAAYCGGGERKEDLERAGVSVADQIDSGGVRILGHLSKCRDGFGFFEEDQGNDKALRFQIGISKPAGRGGRRYLPYVFTELGVAMLSSVLNSDRAIQMTISRQCTSLHKNA